jgi:exodeoxyribonuclease VII large subunit
VSGRAALTAVEDPGRRVLTVSALTGLIKESLEARFGGVWVEGEISNLRVHGSGHVYFTLKDEGAQIRAVLFRSRVRRLRFEPADGLAVLAFANLDVYPVRGEYQLVCELLEPKGLGALQLAFDQLKARLAAEGLFDAARKRPLPAFPRRVGLITSPTGAVARDFLRVLTRRFAGVHVLIHPVRVQGETAAAEIVEALHELNRRGGFDVVVLARGGGSLEDLWAFNEEAVARAIAASKIPVISAVGHETDFTIADFVADLRAPTPSAAAELVVREKAQLAVQLAGLGERLRQAGRRRVRRLADRVAELGRRRVLVDATRPLRDAARRADELGVRLGRAMARRRADAGRRVARAGQALRPALLVTPLRHAGRLLVQLDRRLAQGGTAAVAARRREVTALAGRLDGLSPLAVLARGYSVCTLPSGAVVRRAEQVQAGQPVSVRLARGVLGCRVEDVRDDPPAGPEETRARA